MRPIAEHPDIIRLFPILHPAVVADKLEHHIVSYILNGRPALVFIEQAERIDAGRHDLAGQ